MITKEKIAEIIKAHGMNSVLIQQTNFAEDCADTIFNVLNNCKDTSEAKDPIFQDLLGNDIFEGDDFCLIPLDSIKIIPFIKNIGIGNIKLVGHKFKYLIDAESHLTNNAIIFSLNDFKKYFGDCPPFNMDELEQLAKDRLNLS